LRSRHSSLPVAAGIEAGDFSWVRVIDNLLAAIKLINTVDRGAIRGNQYSCALFGAG